MHYERRKGPKATILLLHGLTGDMRRWDPYLEELGRHDLIRVDLIGHGSSRSPERLEEYASAAQAREIITTLDREGITRCTIITHSHSFSVAAALIEQQPTRFEALIAISPFIRTARHAWRLRLLDSMMPLWPHLKHKRRRSGQTPLADPSLIDIKRGIDEIGMKSYMAHLHACGRLCASSDIPGILICREDEGLCSKDVRAAIATRYPRLQVIALPGKSHLLLRQDHDAILDAIKRSREI